MFLFVCLFFACLVLLLVLGKHVTLVKTHLPFFTSRGMKYQLTFLVHTIGYEMSVTYDAM